MTFKHFFNKYWHALLILYFLFYIPCFGFLNSYIPTLAPKNEVTYMYCKLDDFIPFCELFVIPYFIWFAYTYIGYIYFFFASQKEFFRLCMFMYIGMTVCLTIYFIFPNGQKLRVDYDTLGRDNFLIYCIQTLQGVDTPFNVFPSIHCLNSIALHIAICKSNKIKKFRTPIVISSLILIILIILSTVFTKQHSIVDIFGALALSIPLYLISYLPKYNFLNE